MKLLLILALLVAQIACAPVRSSSQQSPAPTPEDAHARAMARGIVNEGINSTWLMSKTCEPLNLILLDADERGRPDAAQWRRTFPEGTKHLPEVLTSRVIYCRTAACERAIQYVGRTEQDGFKFVVMRFYPTADEMQRIGCAEK